MIVHISSQLIVNWYHQYGRKNLPWQINKTLYTVWISEIMLQQTSVKTVIPYFQKFLLRFPNIKILNNASLDEILYLWSGLGYYSRARNIYKTSKIIEKEFKGQFPDQFSDVIKLPGIGKSTAGAILSLSLNYFYSILDGNVKRILIRYYNIMNDLTKNKMEKKLWNLIELITPIHHTGKFNQAMMDIGSLICTPLIPKCSLCPIKKTCVSFRKNNWKKTSFKTSKTKHLQKESWFVLIEFNNTFWMNQNINKLIWKNLFYFPNFINESEMLNWLKAKKINIKKIKKMPSFFHKFSHFTLNIHPILINLSFFEHSFFLSNNEKGIWFNKQKPQHIGLPKAVQKMLDFLKK
ncbi:A/G-specific adenine glycosylase [Buchnera aphidicola (Muscaphis stroyani)]|uniref:Adenine DNA glycosylase n=1 Tax=Buchnera aphidicola (Muscaphis stroyani) TaxID=1241869 RepID=A0A4D6YJ97_9GAMM|nr:A/G-specific adenine glycosylase [Buchnera aphidicola]QCI24585.1 A/G-specific adenine glycosylase [Buchnera aphidicola (Muscaphis stroyani)]